MKKLLIVFLCIFIGFPRGIKQILPIADTVAPKRKVVVAGSNENVRFPIKYHGGPLVTNPKLFYIFYGNWNQHNDTDTPEGRQILRDFARDVGWSPWFEINKSYSTPDFNIAGGVSYGGETVDGYSQGKKINDDSILKIVERTLVRKRLPYDPEALYFVIISSDVQHTSGFGTAFCGWHSFGLTKVGPVVYAFTGNTANSVDVCASQQEKSPNNNPGIDGTVSIVAHELAEYTTDPIPPSGWISDNGEENSDWCAWMYGHHVNLAENGSLYNVILGKRKYLIQRQLRHTPDGDSCYIDATHQ